MGSKGKSKKHSFPVVDAKGVVFGTLVHNDVATIVASQGIPMLQSNTTGKLYSFPQGIRFCAEMIDEQCEITIRDLTEEVILQREEDDFYEEELFDDDRLMAVESTSDLEEVYNERKIQLFTQLAGHAMTFIAGCGLSFFCWWLSKREFPFPLVLTIGMPVGVLFGIFGGCVPLFRSFRKLSSKIVADEAGNYVNMETGQTNLNGGMRLPVTGR